MSCREGFAVRWFVLVCILIIGAGGTLYAVPSVRIKDVGRVEDSFEEPRGLARLNGLNAVSLIVQKQSGDNTVEVVQRVTDRLDRLRGGSLKVSPSLVSLLLECVDALRQMLPAALGGDTEGQRAPATQSGSPAGAAL